MNIKKYKIFESIVEEESNISLKDDILKLLDSIESGEYTTDVIHGTCDKIMDFTFSDPSTRNILCRKIRNYASNSTNKNLKKEIELTANKLFKLPNNLTEIKLTKQDCRMFNSTWDLSKLLVDNKIQLSGDTLIYDPNDEETINILLKYINL